MLEVLSPKYGISLSSL